MASSPLPRENSIEEALSLARALSASRLSQQNVPAFPEDQQRVLVDAILGAITPDPDPGYDANLDYTDSWPQVEVTVGINEVLRVDVQDLTFDVDCVIFLDWLDPKLRRGEHYVYNAEFGKFELVRTLRDCKDDLRFFNPTVSIVNSKQQAEEADHLPQVFDEVLHEGQDVPWLTKKFHFCGTLSCRNVNAKYFPFDLEDLQIRLTVPDMAGITSLGQDRKVQLAEPVLRKQWRQKRFSKDTAWLQARPSDDNMSHMWSSSDLDNNHGFSAQGIGVGELDVLAFGGELEPEGHEYSLHLVLGRRWYPRYVFDFMILNLQVIASVTSLYVPFSVDMLANRMSITLTVCLTLVSSALGRPPAIESLPYTTTHDTFNQAGLFCVALVGLGNLIVFQNCWGMYRKAGVDDVFDDELGLAVENVRQDGIFGKWVCQVGSCGASNFDCMILYLILSFIVLSITAVITKSQMHRISMLLKIKHQVDMHDQNPGKYSRLVLYHRGFCLIHRTDVIGCAATAALVPCVAIFLKTWRILRRLRSLVCFCRDREPSSLLLAMRAQEMFYMPDDKAKTKKLPQISHFNVKLAPHELFRVLDVGSGEMGFYSYWQDEVTNFVCSSGNQSKFAYNKSQTFVDQFLRPASGAEDLAQLIVQRFDLTPVAYTPPRTPNRSSLEAWPQAEDLTVPEGPPSQPDIPVPGVPDRDTTVSNGTLNAGTPNNRLSLSPCPDGIVPTKSGYLRTTNVAFRSGTKRKLILCLTGANRQMLRDDVDGRAQLQTFVKLVNERLEKFGVECIAYSPEDVDEAMYELWATEWVVQHGDLDVTGMKLEKAYRNLQGGREEAYTTLHEVESALKDLRANEELRSAYCRAATYSRAAQIQHPDGSCDPPARVPCSAFYASFEASPPLLRAHLRARLFSGTLSAGSGSSQVTLRCPTSLESSQVHSLPLGNRTPMVSTVITECMDGSSPFSPALPRTSSLAYQLLVDDTAVTSAVSRHFSGKQPAKTTRETRPAWSEDGPVDAGRLELWRQLLVTCAEERRLPTEQRGLFVGISALFYAAKLAGCAGQVMQRDAFLSRLAAKRDELLKDGKGSGRDLANLTLVLTMVDFVLHRSAVIVCKRSWRVGEAEAQTDFVATWTLGMYLKHSGAMGSPGGGSPLS